jgi:hypothetical protein
MNLEIHFLISFIYLNLTHLPKQSSQYLLDFQRILSRDFLPSIFQKDIDTKKVFEIITLNYSLDQN